MLSELSRIHDISSYVSVGKEKKRKYQKEEEKEFTILVK